MQCEEDEKDSDESDGDNFNVWDFIQAGLSEHDSDSGSAESIPMPEHLQTDERGLEDAKLWRERLKERLFEAKARKRRQRETVHRHFGVVQSNSDDMSTSSQ